MGYSYTMDGKLCCDHCGEAGAKKIPCPVGYCPATALCPTCRKNPEIKRQVAEHHQKLCVPAAARYAKEQEHRELVLKTGAFIRTAALGHHIGGGYHIKVAFKNGAGAEKCYWMDELTYHAFPLGETFTVEDYQQRGHVAEAENNNLHDPH